METLKFKTNLKCGRCVVTVTPYLNKMDGVNNWEVDTRNPDKVLSVHTENVSADDIIDLMESRGYRAELL